MSMFLMLRSVLCCCCLLKTYEMNKNVQMAWAHPVDDQFLRPVDFNETVGKIKVCESLVLANAMAACICCDCNAAFI